MKLIKKLKLNTRGNTSLALIFLCISGCEGSKESLIATLCDGEFARFDASFSKARISLEPWRKDRRIHDGEDDLFAEAAPDVSPASPSNHLNAQGKVARKRSIASLENQKPKEEIPRLADYSYTELNQTDRELWQVWAKERLDEAQKWQDFVRYRPEFKEESNQFGRIANAVVSIYGYATLGNTQGIFRALYSVEEENRQLKAKYCSAL